MCVQLHVKWSKFSGYEVLCYRVATVLISQIWVLYLCYIWAILICERNSLSWHWGMTCMICKWALSQSIACIYVDAKPAKWWCHTVAIGSWYFCYAPVLHWFCITIEPINTYHFVSQYSTRSYQVYRPPKFTDHCVFWLYSGFMNDIILQYANELIAIR